MQLKILNFYKNKKFKRHELEHYTRGTLKRLKKIAILLTPFDPIYKFHSNQP